jgi:dTDP-glucose pyrophosphorylase
MFFDNRQAARLVCRDDATLREAIARLNASEILAQIVVDEQGILLGVLTDGDVRRGILRGVELGDRVTDAMNSEPVVAHPGDPRTVEELLDLTRSKFNFLPAVDRSGRFIGVHWIVRDQGAPAALIMAGGEGRRLGELTRNVPKPLVPVAGRPMIDNVVELLVASGVKKIYVSVHYLAKKMEEWLTTARSDIEINLVHEKNPLGTAGSLSLLPKNLDGDVLVINADVATKINLTGLYSFHHQAEFQGTMAIKKYVVGLPFGVVHAEKDGRFRRIEEKPTKAYMVSAGIYMVGERLRGLVARGARVDMPEVFSLARASGLSLGVFPIHEAWSDIGRPSDLEAADRDALAERAER